MESALKKYLVGVYWTKDKGYGALTPYNTAEEAHEAIERLKKLGYGEKDSPIHMIERCVSKPKEFYRNEN